MLHSKIVAQLVCQKLGQQLGVKLDEPAEEAPLPGGDFSGDNDALALALAQAHAVSPAVARRLVGLYGTEADQVLALGSEPLANVPGSATGGVTGEVDWAVAVEGATSVEDIIYRRTRVALYDLQARTMVEGVAHRMGALLGWDESRVAAELRQVRNRLAEDLHFEPSPAAAGQRAGVPVRA